MIEKGPTPDKSLSINKCSKNSCETERYDIGKSIAERIKNKVNKSDWSREKEEEDIFTTVYLTKRKTILPENLASEDTGSEIISMLYFIYDGVRSELQERLELEERFI